MIRVEARILLLNKFKKTFIAKLSKKKNNIKTRINFDLQAIWAHTTIFQKLK
jgi:hypothetical protein